MAATLKIKEAIEHYNFNRPKGSPILTAASLAQKVFEEKKSKPECKIVLFYQIINNRRKLIDLRWLEVVSQETGYPVNELIEFTK